MPPDRPGGEHPLGEEFEDVADHRAAEVPDCVDLEWIQGECERLERILRLQHSDPTDPTDEGEFDPRDEFALAQRPLTNLRSALRRWAYLKHLYISRQQNLERRTSEADEDTLDVMRRLIRREPVPVELQGGRTVEVTDRSWAALFEMARHGRRINTLREDLQRIDTLENRILDRIDDDGPTPVLRRRLQGLRDLAESGLEEIQLHRKAIYAHLMTDDGAPADSLDDAPDWWTEVTPLDDVLLVSAAQKVGPDLYAKLGEMPDPPERDSDSEWINLETFGWLTPFKRWDKDMPVEAAPCENQPMGQLLARVRAGADKVLDPGDKG